MPCLPLKPFFVSAEFLASSSDSAILGPFSECLRIDDKSVSAIIPIGDANKLSISSILLLAVLGSFLLAHSLDITAGPRYSLENGIASELEYKIISLL